MSRTRTPQERILSWAVHAPREEVDLLTRYLKAVATEPPTAKPRVARKPRKTVPYIRKPSRTIDSTLNLTDPQRPTAG